MSTSDPEEVSIEVLAEIWSAGIGTDDEHLDTTGGRDKN